MTHHLFKTPVIWCMLFIHPFTHAQNTSVNGTTIGGKRSDLISTACAIIIHPTDKEMKEITKTEGADSLQTNNDNVNLSISIIKSYLDSTHTPIIEKEAKGELKFKLIDGKTYTLSIHKLYWNVFLFNGESIPIQVNITDFARQYIHYMTLEK